MRTRGQGTDLDVAYLATTFDVPEASLQTLIDAPTADLISAFLESLTIKGQELDVLKADKLKVDVELDNTVRTSETKVKAQKAAVSRAQKEVEELRTKLNESEAAREALAAQLDQLHSSASGSSVETSSLRQRIETLEASNREALALVERKSTEKDQVAQDLAEQHAKLLTLRREVGQLEEKNQALENAATSQKFKEQSLQQEIDLLKKNNEWHSAELQTRSQEHTKFRKERNARISTLERALEDSNANVDALKRTESTLRQRLDELQSKAEEAFARIASLQEEAARKEQEFRTEVNSSKRLGELQAQNAATHKARLQEVQAQVDQIKDDAAEEIGRLQAEVETERSDKEAAELRLAELELSVERLEQRPRPSRPGTPMRNGGPQTPGRGGLRDDSPSAMPGSLRKVVNGLSFTQLLTNYNEAQEELENERRRTNKLSTALDELISEIESRKPDIEELKEEQERLENEVLDFSRLLDEANDGREVATRESQRWEAEAEAAAREGQILRQQLRDLSAQIKILLVEVQSRDQGLGELSAEERLELERAARGELEDGSLDEMTSTGRLISEQLVIFRDMSDLQAQNAKLLRLTRELGDKMEGEEAREQARQSAADAQEVEELRQQVERYKDELQATTVQIGSYMKERDMFRRMLQHRGQLAPDADLQSLFGQSMAPGTPQRNSVGPPATPRSKDAEDLNKLLKEQQAFFDQYRTESSTDRRMLKDQADALARDKNSLQADLARAQSQLTLAAERYEMLNSNFVGLRSENGELQKRSQQLAEQAARQDLRTQQVVEELVEARSMAESIRNENANAKAEKELWKRIEARLNDENKTLLDDRSRLNKLVTNLQNLQNERELSESENRRRLQSRVESLESELNENKRKLESELEDSRKAALRREYDDGQNRTRIDDLVKSLGNVREDLVAAKTSRDSLQARVDEMKIELRAAEEKITALQPRPTPRAEPSKNDGQHTNGDADDLPQEQRLAIEASELRRDLELTKAELDSARQQVEQFRSIAQTTEEELAQFSQTADQYKEDMDLQTAQKDARVQELEQRVEDLNSELTATNSELSELRSKADDNGRQLAEQKAMFDSTIGTLVDDKTRLQEEKKLIHEDTKMQAEIAQQAQQSYENELQKHAEAARSLQAVRSEYNELRTEVAGIKAEADAAKASLERSEESWSEQRDHFERELEEAKRKRQDVDEQNKLLHQQMETFSNELATLRQGRASTIAANGEPRDGTSFGSTTEGSLQEVVNYLRREKEIVDVQYELSTQETKRLQQQLDYANSQLEEIRQKLADERRQSTERSKSDNSTNKLMQTINELNVYRESATTLRNEARQARENLEEKNREVERLVAEIEPLKSKVGELEGELEIKSGEMKLLQDDRDHWRERTQNIISKYDRVDPAELEEMKKRLEELSAEKQRLENEQAPLIEQVENFEARMEAETTRLTERIDKFREQAKGQDQKRKATITSLSAEKDSAQSEARTAQEALTAASTELEHVKSQVEQTRVELEQTKSALEVAQANAVKAKADDAEEGQVEEDGIASEQQEEHAALHSRIAEAQASASEHASRADALSSEVQTLQARVEELDILVAQLQEQLEAAKLSTGDEQTQAPAETAEVVEKLKQDLATALQKVETARGNAAVESTQPTVNTDPAPGEKSVAEQVADEVAKLRTEMEQQHELATQQMVQQHDKKVENLRNGLRKQLKDGRDAQRDEAQRELRQQHEFDIQRLKDEHDAALEKLKADHQAEIDRLAKQGSVVAMKTEESAPTLPSSDAKAEAPTADAQGKVQFADTDMVKLEFTHDQARSLVQSNSQLKALLTASVRTHVEKQTEKLRAAVAEKDERIKALEQELKEAKKGSAAGPDSSGGTTDSANADKVRDLEQKLEAAKTEKESAIKSAVEAAEKKFKVQISQLGIIRAKMNAVQSAVKETPDKPVKEVWEIAEKARPPPAKPPGTPGQGAAAVPASSAVPANQPTAAKTPNPQATEFKPGESTGSPSAIAVPKPATSGAAPAQRSASGTSSGIPQPGATTAPAGSKLPRAGGPPSRQASIGGPGGLQIQGAANASNLPRGGLSSGLPRGGGLRGGRGGARGGPSNAANAGQKRSHDGSEGGGDPKRSRGGGAAGGS